MSAISEVSTRRAKLLIGGEWIEGRSTFPVFDKFSGELIGEADAASEAQVKSAVENARKSFETEPLEPYKRYEILMRTAQLIEQHRDEFVGLIIGEAGFPALDANNEVTRAVQTFTTSAEEGKRLSGEIIPIEASPGNAHRMAFTIRVPRGVVCGITSFNSPLNMVAHKVAPALASGNTVVVKPPKPTPFSAMLLFQILLEAGLPAGHANLIQGPGSEIGVWLVNHPAISFYSFTGSTGVGKKIRDAIGLRPLALELGSVSATIVCKDADLKRAVPRCLNSGFRRAGQACTSIQRLYVAEGIADEFLPRLIEGASKLKVGDPHDPRTEIGPMISEEEAKRAEAWIREAVRGGARIVHGGTRSGSLLQPTILTNVNLNMRIACEEVFAPVLSVLPYQSLAEVIEQVNALPYGLAAGVFTKDINTAMRVAKSLHVGIVHINESSSSRVDLMPFGGVKDSGIGREGPRYAMHEMTEERLVTMSVE
ncbi:MAG: aldehyde dehydrogenase family protein [Acidobacteriaceae bacterium]|nr:aldehyde dehydrogenase family protein [Acidobacteriaceae bacterium]